MLKEALQRLDLELAAEYFMSDFEYAIRDAFQSTFRDIEVKGCVFHYTKAILSKVTKSGFKSDYENCPKFSAFIRAIFSLAYVPLSRLAEAVRNLYIFAKACESDRQIKFCSVMIRYVERVWINGSFPQSSWNVYQHDGETTNNKSECTKSLGREEDTTLKFRHIQS